MGNSASKLKSSRKQFGKAFKVEAVRLLESGDKPVTQLARELGVARNQLYKWQTQLRQHGEAHAFPGQGAKPLDERSEIELLRRELKKVTEERDILKKAKAYFAKYRS
jgi:transposase